MGSPTHEVAAKARRKLAGHGSSHLCMCRVIPLIGLPELSTQEILYSCRSLEDRSEISTAEVNIWRKRSKVFLTYPHVRQRTSPQSPNFSICEHVVCITSVRQMPEKRQKLCYRIASIWIVKFGKLHVLLAASVTRGLAAVDELRIITLIRYHRQILSAHSGTGDLLLFKNTLILHINVSSTFFL